MPRCRFRCVPTRDSKCVNRRPQPEGCPTGFGNRIPPLPKLMPAGAKSLAEIRRTACLPGTMRLLPVVRSRAGIPHAFLRFCSAIRSFAVFTGTEAAVRLSANRPHCRPICNSCDITISYVVLYRKRSGTLPVRESVDGRRLSARRQRVFVEPFAAWFARMQAGTGDREFETGVRVQKAGPENPSERTADAVSEIGNRARFSGIGWK